MQDKDKQTQKFNSEKTLQDLVRKRNSSPDGQDEIVRKLDEILSSLNTIKNGTTVNTGPHEALTRLFTGQYMYVDTRDSAASPHLMMSGTWEEDITKAFLSILDKDDVVLDIGANFGYFGTIAGTDMGENGRIVFVEPNPYLIPYIKKTAAVNGILQHSDVMDVAISDQEGEVTFKLLKDNWVSSGIVDVKQLSKDDRVEYKLEEDITVKTTTIDYLCDKLKIDSVDTIKIDVEGFEPQAFKGMQKTLKQSPHLKMLLEFTPKRYEEPERFFNDIRSHFDFTYIVTETGELQPVHTYDEMLTESKKYWAMLVAAKEPQ